MDEIENLMRLLTGAESTLVVNNNAAALLLVLSSLASGREAIVSRGEAVEIGGSFRIPDVLRQSGATLVEVGTTNRTYLSDYKEAITENTGALLKVHPSNFSLKGFVYSTPVRELADLAKVSGLPLINDLGSGALLDTSEFGLEREPTIQFSLVDGSSVVTASGDKLLGGPQGGIVCGSRELVARIASHPLARAVRADKTCLAGMAATLRHYARGEAVDTVPVWRMIAAESGSVRNRADWLSNAVGKMSGATVVGTRATTGGGSLPGQSLESWGVAFSPVDYGNPQRLARLLRAGRPPLLPIVQDGRVIVDLRTILPEDDELAASAILGALATV
jgi:L-seryl-tRNA(Ser) seleniumtransferase